jgi:hypothetical protein
MREDNARPVAVLVQGLPEALRTPEVSYAVETYVKTRLVIYNGQEILPCIGLMCGEALQTVTIEVLGDYDETVRRDIARYTEESLRQRSRQNAERLQFCVFRL